MFFMFVGLLRHPFYGLNTGKSSQAMGWVYLPCSTNIPTVSMLISWSFGLNSVGISLPDTTRKSNTLLAYKLFLLLFLPPLPPLLFLFQMLSLSVTSTCVPIVQGAPERGRAGADVEQRYTVEKSHHNMALSNVKEN